MLPLTRSRSKPQSAGWLVTFADLMTLLLTFFILLLSFSNIDAQKYKMIAQSMAQSFGVFWIPRDVPVSVIEVPAELPAPAPESPPSTDAMRPMDVPPASPADTPAARLAEALIDDLAVQVEEKVLTVSYDQEKVLVRFSQEASFPTGSAELKEGMDRILARVARGLSRCDGEIRVDGYTDDQPIVSTRFRSNWDLSAARAVSVVHALVDSGWIDPERITAAGHAHTHPLASNETEAGRALNRRVEIKVYNPACQEE